ncbi:MAG: rRNA maturation RNase YbeY [Anaerolineaceae bacterium]
MENSVRAVLERENQIQEVDLSIVIENDESVRELNEQYRGINAPTDVLSFEANQIDPETGIKYLGDIIISLDQAKRQAKKSNHPLIAELQLLAVHGTLHLLGYDHADEEEKRVMWALQKEILTFLGAGLIVWPEE